MKTPRGIVPAAKANAVDLRSPTDRPGLRPPILYNLSPRAMNTLRSLRAACAPLLLLFLCVACSHADRQPLPLRPAGASSAAIDAAMPQGRDLSGDTLLRRDLTEYFSAFADVYFGGGELGPATISDTTIEHFGVLLVMARERYIVDASSSKDYYRIPVQLVDSVTSTYFGRTIRHRGLDRWSQNGGYIYREGYYYFHRYDFDSHDDEGEGDWERYHPQIVAMVEGADGTLTVQLNMLDGNEGPNGSGEVDHRVVATVHRAGRGFTLTRYAIQQL